MLSQYSIDTLEQELEAMLHGTTLNQITNLRGIENRAARQLLLDLDPQETKRVVEFINPIYNSVFDYPIADDVKGNKIVDIFPQVRRLPIDIWTQAYNQNFDVAKQNIYTSANLFTMNFNTGMKTIRIDAPFLNAPQIINQADSLTTNGTWTAGGDAADLEVNNTNFVQGAGSLQFEVDTNLGGAVASYTLTNPGTGYSNGLVTLSGGTGTGMTATIAVTLGVITSINPETLGEGYMVGDVLTFVGGANNATITVDAISNEAYVVNSTMNAVDLSEVQNQSALFVWVYVPTGTSLSLVTLLWGSSPTDTFGNSVTENQQGVAFVNGWNLCKFDWGVNSGTPDASDITYVKVILTVTGDMSGVKVNGINSILGTILSYEYYSKYMFRDATTGAFQETVTDGTDLINLDTETFNLYLNLVASYAVQQQQGDGAMAYDAQFFKTAYEEGVARYKAMYKSEVQKPQGVYYKKPDTTYNRIIGRGWY